MFVYDDAIAAGAEYDCNKRWEQHVCQLIWGVRGASAMAEDSPDL